MMFFCVLRVARIHSKIFRAVILSVSVEMVNDFISPKRPTKHLLGNHTVFAAVSAANPNFDIATFINVASTAPLRVSCPVLISVAANTGHVALAAVSQLVIDANRATTHRARCSACATGCIIANVAAISGAIIVKP